MSEFTLEVIGIGSVLLLSAVVNAFVIPRKMKKVRMSWGTFLRKSLELRLIAFIAVVPWFWLGSHHESGAVYWWISMVVVEYVLILLVWNLTHRKKESVEELAGGNG